MLRAVLAVVVSLTLLPVQGWAQIARVRSAPAFTPLAAPGIVLPDFAAAGLDLSLSPALDLNLNLDLDLGVAPELALGRPELSSSQQKPAALPLSLAAKTASMVTKEPGSFETDARKIDFTRPQVRPEAGPVADLAASRFITRAPFRADNDTPNGPRGPNGAVPEPADQPEETSSPRLWSFLGGIFSSQVANNALHVALPLGLAAAGATLGQIGLVIGAVGLADTAGTFIAGRFTGDMKPRTLLIGATAVRAAALGAAAAFLFGGALSLPLAVALYSVDALARGATDTARNTVPMFLAKGRKSELQRINGLYQTFFDAGGLAGPFLIGGLLIALGNAQAHWIMPAAFALAAAFFFGVPGARAAQKEVDAEPAAAAPGGFKTIFKNPALRAAFFAAVLLTVYPLRSILPAAFALEFLGNQAATAWLVGAFGLGGMAGAFLFSRLHAKTATKWWLRGGALGIVALAAAWIPGGFWPMLAGIALFALSNSAARMAAQSALQLQIPSGREKRVMGLTRFAANLTATALKFGAGLAFAGFASAQTGFLVVSLALGAVSAGVMLTANTPAPATPHGYPGRLIVVEGLDGSGKSTQLDLLKQRLEAHGHEVVLTSWNTSTLIAGAVKRAKQGRELTPQTFAMLEATDLMDRTQEIIEPALKAGKIVLADRYVYTAYARGTARGNTMKFLKGLYDFALKPDMVLYFKLPVETAIDRVLSRSEGPRLSEDFEDDPAEGEGPRVKYYEGGLDAKLSNDPVENFHLFQNKVKRVYDELARKHKFLVFDAGGGIEEQRADVLKRVLPRLPAASFAPAKTEREGNLFDKDPAGDSKEQRKNYQHPKFGAHHYFRNAFIPMQERFARLMDMKEMPRVFLHGNAHVDNYAKTRGGAAAVDFDRAAIGPYAWDVVRLMVSLSLRQKNPGKSLVPKSAAQAFLRGYLRTFDDPSKPISELRKLRDIQPEGPEVSTDAYLAADIKWAKKMRERPIAADDATLRHLLKTYLEMRGEPDLLEDYFVEEAGYAYGSQGETGRWRYLVVLAPKVAGSAERIFLDMKETRNDVDSEWYTIPYVHQGVRMVEAAKLYAPHFEERAGAATAPDGANYWVRQVPTQNVKLKNWMKEDDLVDYAYAVGTQIGRGHALTVESHGSSKAGLRAHLLAHFWEILEAGETLVDEIQEAHLRYLKKLKKKK